MSASTKGNVQAGPKASTRVGKVKLEGASAKPDPIASHAVRVLCVDDHAVLIEGLRAQFAIDGSIEIVGKLSSATNLLQEVARLQPHAILLDIEMPGPDVFEMANRVLRMYPKVRVIMLSAHVRDTFISAAFAAGASAYFSKSEELEDIVNGIREVVRSRDRSFVMGPKVKERCLIQPFHAGASARRGVQAEAEENASAETPATLLSSLTPREVEVLRLIGKGHSRNEIAKQLCRCAKTIDGHQERMMKKLGIESRSNLMRFAIREGLANA